MRWKTLRDSVDLKVHVEVPSQELIPLARVPSREQILRLERELMKCPQIEIPVRHYHCKGLYAREITIPKGIILTGKTHRTEHLNILSKGDITVLTDSGMKRLQGPYTMVSQPGTKRVGYTHEETVWTTIHASDETDLEVLEAQLIVPDNLVEAEIREMLK